MTRRGPGLPPSPRQPRHGASCVNTAHKLQPARRYSNRGSDRDRDLRECRQWLSTLSVLVLLCLHAHPAVGAGLGPSVKRGISIREALALTEDAHVSPAQFKDAYVGTGPGPRGYQPPDGIRDPAVDAEDAFADQDMARDLVEAGDLEGAVPLLEHAVLADAPNADAWAELGEVYSRLRRHDDAIRCYKTCATLQPGNAIGHANIGYALAALGRYREAATALKYAIMLDPNNAGPVAVLGEALYRTATEKFLIESQVNATAGGGFHWSSFVEPGGTSYNVPGRSWSVPDALEQARTTRRKRIKLAITVLDAASKRAASGEGPPIAREMRGKTHALLIVAQEVIGEYGDAEASFRAVLASTKSMRDLEATGVALSREGSHDAAALMFITMARQNPNHPHAAHNVGMLLTSYAVGRESSPSKITQILRRILSEPFVDDEGNTLRNVDYSRWDGLGHLKRAQLLALQAVNARRHLRNASADADPEAETEAVAAAADAAASEEPDAGADAANAQAVDFECELTLLEDPFGAPGFSVGATVGEQPADSVVHARVGADGATASAGDAAAEGATAAIAPDATAFSAVTARFIREAPAKVLVTLVGSPPRESSSGARRFTSSKPYGPRAPPHSMASLDTLIDEFAMDTEPWRSVRARPRVPELAWRERHVFATVLPNVTVSGTEPVVHDECTVYADAHAGYHPLDVDKLQLEPGVEDASAAADAVFGLRRGPSVVHVDTAVSLAQMSQRSYFHWLCEALPRLAFSLDALRADPSIRLLVPGRSESGAMLPFVEDSLRLLGLADEDDGEGAGAAGDGDGDGVNAAQTPGDSESRIVPVNASVTVHAKRLLTVDWRPSDGKPGQEFLAPAVALRRVRELFVPEASRPAYAERNLVVWASRNGPERHGHRKVHNEGPLMDALRDAVNSAPRGADGAPPLELVYFDGGDATFEEQVALFSRARVLIGVHGGALSNAVFCAPGTSLVELTLPEPFYRMYAHLAAALDLQYWAVPGAPPGSFDDDVVADAAQVAAVLRRILV